MKTKKQKNEIPVRKYDWHSSPRWILLWSIVIENLKAMYRRVRNTFLSEVQFVFQLDNKK